MSHVHDWKLWRANDSSIEDNTHYDHELKQVVDNEETILFISIFLCRCGVWKRVEHKESQEELS